MLELCKSLKKYLNAFYKKGLISLTNERINQKTVGVKPHRLDPGWTTVFIAERRPVYIPLTKTYLKPSYIPSYVTVVTVMTEVTVVTVVTAVTVLTYTG